jgi:hypothetical protein
MLYERQHSTTLGYEADKKVHLQVCPCELHEQTD